MQHVFLNNIIIFPNPSFSGQNMNYSHLKNCMIMEPVCVSSKPSYLHAAGAATFKAMTDSDPQAVW